MTIADSKNINLADYLQSLGYTPHKRQGNQLWYYSPFRKEHTPSFKINLNRNEWYDFGTGEHGDIVDFVKILYNTDVSKALQIISGRVAFIPTNSFSLHRQENSPGFEDIKVRPLTNPALIQYLNERKVHIPFAEQLCEEVYYKVNGKPYFAIGFENDKGGFTLRNKYSQNCTSSDITTFDKGKAHCVVFEGFIDYLSFLTIKGKPSIESNVVILNSVNNLNKATEFLKQHGTIYTFLDNDDAGRKCLNEIRKLDVTVSDQSKMYNGYKDMNDYLCGKKQVQQKQQKRGMRL